MPIAVRVLRSSSWFARIACALAAALTIAPLHAQEANVKPAATGTEKPAAKRMIVVQNLAPHPRREVASAVVPFARGTVRDDPGLHVGDAATAWQPFGARWPDGSWRQALCLFSAELPAAGEVSLPLNEGTGPLPDGAFADLPGTLVVIARTNLGEARQELPLTAMLEDNAMRKV
ncbi:MAG: hypothetical protein ABL997_18650, partial [Planctomycetota bacterium]